MQTSAFVSLFSLGTKFQLQFQVPLVCFVQFDKADTPELEVEYRCEDRPMDVGAKYGDAILV